MTPGVELGLRHNAGGDRPGTAVELGAEVHFVSADGLLHADGHAKGYLASDDGNGWEVGGQLVMSPDARGRGLSFTLAPAWGAVGGDGPSAPSGAWYARDGELSAGRLAAELGYGAAMGGGRGIVRPYAGVEWREGGERSVRFGARWGWREASRFSLEAEREKGENGNDAYTFIAGAELRW